MGGVILQADYTFQAGDNGSYTFTAAVTLFTPGDEIITVADMLDGISGDATVYL